MPSLSLVHYRLVYAGPVWGLKMNVSIYCLHLPLAAFNRTGQASCANGTDLELELELDPEWD